MEEDINLKGEESLDEDTEMNNSESDADSNIEEREDDANVNMSTEETSGEDDENLEDMELREDGSLATVLSQDLEMYQQDHNPDHLFDYLNNLHLSFVKTMGLEPEQQQPQQQLQTVPAVSNDQPVMVPAEISTSEMKIDLPKETAVDVRS